jgi:hypothetical protein
VRHYRLAWPIFDNGMSCVAVHAITEHGDSYQKILHDGERWHSIGRLEEEIEFEPDDMGFKFVQWKAWDEEDRLWEFTGTPLFRWQFPFDTFVMVEQMMEFRLSDGTIGYGMGKVDSASPGKAMVTDMAKVRTTPPSTGSTFGTGTKSSPHQGSFGSHAPRSGQGPLRRKDRYRGDRHAGASFCFRKHGAD